MFYMISFHSRYSYLRYTWDITQFRVKPHYRSIMVRHFSHFTGSILSPHQSGTRRRHLMEIFSALLALCKGNPPVTGGFPSQRPVTRNFENFFDLCLNNRLNNQSRRRWSETPSHPLWRHCNGSGIPWVDLSYGSTRASAATTTKHGTSNRCTHFMGILYPEA